MKRNRAVVFDVGANMGQTASRYRKLLPKAEIYAFEPFPDSIAALRERVAGDDHIHVVPNAVSSESGLETFYVNGLAATNSLLPRPASDRRYYPRAAETRTSIQVEATSLDEFVETRGLSSVDVLKLDIQGGELKALRGARSLLASGKVTLIYSEIMFVPHYEGAPLFHEIWTHLAGFGYSLFDVYDLHRAGNGQLRYGDALFVSDFARKHVIDRFPEEP
ncbi:MAG: FkbM family methyltransferase [Thiobacillus sp.]|nr:FkbM family methyltransferase [Thiobacillus sp.]